MKRLFKGVIGVVTAMLIMIMASCFVSADTYPTPTQVSGLKQTQSAKTSVKIIWTLYSSKGYEVSYCPDGTEDWKTKTAINGEYTINELLPGTTYKVKVRGFNDQTAVNVTDARAYGDYSEILYVATTPELVTNVRQIKTTSTSATIQCDFSNGATQYRVCDNTGGKSKVLATLDGNTNTYTFEGLDNKEKKVLIFSVIADRKLASGYTAESPGGVFVSGIKLVPPKVQNFHYNDLGIVKWDAANYADGYEVEVCKKGSSKVFKKYNAKMTQDGLKGIKKNQFYVARVRGYVSFEGKKYYGPWSKNICFAGKIDVKVKKISATKNKATWKKVKGATSYTVYISSSAADVKYATVKKNKCIIKKVVRKGINLNVKGSHMYVVANCKVNG